MADLTSIANRVTDNQVAPNKPITTSLHQTYGSNINYLLDFLGISNGATGTSGALSDLIQAVEEVSTHTDDLQVSLPVSGGANTVSVGAYTQNPFVNHVFYMAVNITGAGISASGFEHVPWLSGSGSNFIELYYNRDGGTNFSIGGAPIINQQINPSVGEPIRVDQSQVSLIKNDINSERVFTKSLNLGASTTPLPGSGTYVLPILELDYRDAGTIFNISCRYGNGVGGLTSIYRAKKLNIGSLGF